MSLIHWVLVGFACFIIADAVFFWIVNANHARRICELERLVMRQDHVRRKYESEMRVAERRRKRP